MSDPGFGGGYDLGGRLSHSTAAVRAASDQRQFYVPAEHIGDLSWLTPKVHSRGSIAQRSDARNLTAAIAVDGSSVIAQVRDGLPSVLYGFAQAAAAYVDLTALESQSASRFVDPAAIQAAISTALITLDLPVAGAFVRAGISIEDSWREAIFELFGTKRIEINRLDRTLMELLFDLHGVPDQPAVTLPVRCCQSQDVAVGLGGAVCPDCGRHVFPTDLLRIHEEVSDEGSNGAALGRLLNVLELLVLVGLVSLIWREARDRIREWLFIVDGPLAMFGTPAKLQFQAQRFFQSMHWPDAEDPGQVIRPHICGVEKSGPLIDYARQLSRHDVLQPGDLLVCDADVIKQFKGPDGAASYGKETYWGRKFVYRSADGRVLIPNVPPGSGPAYDSSGGQPGPDGYPTLAAILDVIDRTGSSIYVDGVIPVALAHGHAAFPIGIGTDVLKLVAIQRLTAAQGRSTR